MMSGRQEAGELSAHLLRLTHALYRVTDRMPREEPLRHGMREKAGKIFSVGVAVVHGKDNNGEADDAWVAIEILLGYLAMAPILGCADPANFMVLEREYRLVAEELAARPKPAPTPVIPPTEIRPPVPEDRPKAKEDVALSMIANLAAGESPMDAEVNERQRKIMERLAGLGRVKISDFYGIFGAISSKTIQRDLQDLTTRNMIKKEGEKRWTIYTLA